MIHLKAKRFKFLYTSFGRDSLLLKSNVTSLTLPGPYGVTHNVSSKKYINSLFQGIKRHYHSLMHGFFLEIIPEGVGYKFLRYPWAPRILGLGLGYSHFTAFRLPAQCLFRCTKYRLFLYSGNKSILNQIGLHIIRLRTPDPYKSKGLKFPREALKLKPGKLRQK